MRAHGLRAILLVERVIKKKKYPGPPVIARALVNRRRGRIF